MLPHLTAFKEDNKEPMETLSNEQNADVPQIDSTGWSKSISFFFQVTFTQDSIISI